MDSQHAKAITKVNSVLCFKNCRAFIHKSQKHNLLKLLITLILIAGSLFSFGQSNGSNSQNWLTPTQLQADFLTFTNSLKEIHPSMYRYTSKNDFEALEKEIGKSLIDSMTDMDFHILLRNYIRLIGCGHTAALPSKEFYALQKIDSKLLPFKVYLIEDKLYIKKSFVQDSILIPGTEILAIDGHNTAEMLDIMKNFQNRDGFNPSYDKYNIEDLFSTYYLFIYGRSEDYNLKVRIDTKPYEIKLKAGVKEVAKKERYYGDSIGKKVLTSNYATLYHIQNTPHTALLDINTFPSRKYREFTKKTFKNLNNNNIENLIIDLRDNGGGYFLNGMRILNGFTTEGIHLAFDKNPGKVKKNEQLQMHFSSKVTMMLFNLMPDQDKADPQRNYRFRAKPNKKKKYTDKIYVLTNGGSFSLSSYLATWFQIHTDAVIVGQETGGGKDGSNAIGNFTLTLKHSKLRVVTPYYHVQHQKGAEQTARGVLPDFPVTYSIEDRIAKRDKELEKVLELISK